MIGCARASRQNLHSAGFFAVVCIISFVRCCIFVIFMVVSHLLQTLGACESDSESGNLKALQATPQSTQNASGSSLNEPTPIQVVKATSEVFEEERTPTQSAAKNRADEQNQPKSPPTQSAAKNGADEQSQPKLPPTKSAAKNGADEQNQPKSPSTQSAAKNRADEQNQRKSPLANEVEHMEVVVQEGINAVESMMQAQDKLESPESPIFLSDMVQTSKKRKKNDDGEWLLCYMLFLRRRCSTTMFLLSHS